MPNVVFPFKHSLNSQLYTGSDVQLAGVMPGYHPVCTTIRLSLISVMLYIVIVTFP